MNAPLPGAADQARLLRRGFVLKVATLGWNAAGVVVLAVAAQLVGLAEHHGPMPCPWLPTIGRPSPAIHAPEMRLFAG